MHKDKDMQLSIYSVLYNKIPDNHTLKILKDVIGSLAELRYKVDRTKPLDVKYTQRLS